MSYQIGFDAIHLKPGPRLAHTEYCSNEQLMKAVRCESGQAFEDAWELDLIWSNNDGPVPWAERGRTTDMGHAEFLEGGVDRRAAQACPFTNPEEVLAFDAVEEYGLPDYDELVTYYEAHYQEQQRARPNQVFTAGGVRFPSLSADGYSVEVGVNSALTNRLTGYALAGYEDGDDYDGDFYGRLGAQVKFNPNWSASADVKFADGVTQWFVGPRYSW